MKTITAILSLLIVSQICEAKLFSGSVNVGGSLSLPPVKIPNPIDVAKDAAKQLTAAKDAAQAAAAAAAQEASQHLAGILSDVISQVQSAASAGQDLGNKGVDGVQSMVNDIIDSKKEELASIASVLQDAATSSTASSNISSEQSYYAQANPTEPPTFPTTEDAPIVTADLEVALNA